MDYWLGVAGAKGVKLDWPRTWKNRMRDQQERAERFGRQTYAQASGNGPYQNPPDPDSAYEGDLI